MKKPTNKVCKGCLKVKSLDEYSRAAKNSDGLTSKCKDCVAALNRIYYAKRPSPTCRINHLEVYVMQNKNKGQQHHR